jgi:SAM-dependent methyltransferase
MTNVAPDAHWGSEAVDPRGRNLPALKVKFLLDHLGDGARTLVEIGSGDGKLLRTIAAHRPGLELHGCDIREPRTRPGMYAFRRLTEDGPLPYDAGTFDVALTFDVLEHVPSPAGLLDEVARVLKPSGRLVAFVPVEGEPLSSYEVWRRLLGRDVYAHTKEHIQAFTHDELRRLLDDRFDVRALEYAYHALGQAMDATFFAATRIPRIGSFWWNDNAYYNAKPKTRSPLSFALNALLELGNGVAWAESSLLKNSRVGAAGILVEARKR